MVKAKIMVWRVNVDESSVFAGPTCHAATRSVFATTLGGSVCRLDADSGAILWSRSLEKPIFTSAIISSDKASRLHLFVGDCGGHMSRLDAKDGSIVSAFVI